MMSPKRLAILAVYAALGPITGPVAAGVIRNLRAGAPILAGLYVLAGVAVWTDLGLLSAWSASVLAR